MTVLVQPEIMNNAHELQSQDAKNLENATLRSIARSRADVGGLAAARPPTPSTAAAAKSAPPPNASPNLQRLAPSRSPAVPSSPNHQNLATARATPARAALTKSADYRDEVNAGHQAALRPPDPRNAPELEPRGSATLVPQPPAGGSPIANFSPRLRSVSSRVLHVRPASLPQLPDGIEEGPDGALRVAPSPRGASASSPSSALDPGRRSVDSAQPSCRALFPDTPASVTDDGGASGTCNSAPPQLLAAAATAAAAGAASAMTSAIRQVSADLLGVETEAAAAATTQAAPVDPWVAIREHCMTMYGGGLDSSDDEGGIDGEELVHRTAGAVMLMRHPSLVRRSLSRSFGGEHATEFAAAAKAVKPHTTAAGGPTAVAVASWPYTAAIAAAVPSAAMPAKQPSPVLPQRSTSGQRHDTSTAVAVSGRQTGPTPVPVLGTSPSAVAHVTLPNNHVGAAAAAAAASLDMSLKGAATGVLRRSTAASQPGITPGMAVGGPLLHGPLSERPSSAFGAVPQPQAARRSRQTSCPSGGDETMARSPPPQLPLPPLPAATTSFRLAAARELPGARATSPNFDPMLLQEQGLLGGDLASGLVDAFVGLGSGSTSRMSDAGGAVIPAAGSILDVASMATDPVRMRRLSADGLTRHASKYSGSTTSCADVGGGAAATTAAGAVLGSSPKSSPGAQGVTPPASLMPLADGGGHVGTASAGGGTTAGVSSGGGGSGSGSGAAARAPLITALAFERAPWSQPSGPPSSGAASPVVHAGLATGPRLSGGGAASSAAMSPSALFYGLSPPSFPAAATVAAGPAASADTPADRAEPPPIGSTAAATPAAAAAAASVVDKLRGFRSSKVLMNSLMAPASANIPTALHQNAPSASGVVGSGGGGSVSLNGGTAVTGLSPPKPKLGAFISMRTLHANGTAAPPSFLERLSANNSSLIGPNGHLLNHPTTRRSIGGVGTARMQEWGPSDSGSRRSFRRRDGSCSMDGSVGGSLAGDEMLVGSAVGTQLAAAYASEGGGMRFGSGATTEPGAAAGGLETGAENRNWGAGADLLGLGDAALGDTAGRAAMAAGVLARRSYKQLLPRGPNGLPLAWSTVIEEDGREGERDADEEEDDDDDEEDGFNLARAGGRTDLHITC